MEPSMNNQVIYGWVFVIVYILVILYFVIRGALKTKNISDYALGNITFSPIFVALSFAAATTSAATFIINPGFVSYFGLSAFLSIGLGYPIPAILSFIILSKSFQKFGSTVKANTIAQWIGKRYSSKVLELYFAFLSILLITFITLILVGISQVLSKLINVDIYYVLTAVVIFIFGYMMFGGANTMVYTNTVQAIIMIIAAIILLTSGYEYFLEGNFWNKLKEIDPLLAEPTNPNSPLFRDFYEIFFFQFLIGIAIICQPHILTKSLLLKSEKDVNKYLFYGTIVQFLFFMVVFTGFYARLAFPDLMFNDQKIKMDEIISFYIVYKFSELMTIFLAFGVISAGISTLEGLIQSLSTVITVDIIGKLYKDDEKKEKQLFLINKIVIFIIGVMAWYFSYDQITNPKLSVAIFAQTGVYGFFAASFIPILFGTFLKNANKLAVSVASITATFLHFWIFYTGYFPLVDQYMFDSNGNLLSIRNPGVSAAIAILISTILAIILQILSSKFKFFNKGI